MSSLRPGFRARAAAESGTLFGGGCYLEFEVVISSAPESGILFGGGIIWGGLLFGGGVSPLMEINGVTLVNPNTKRHLFLITVIHFKLIYLK